MLADWILTGFCDATMIDVVDMDVGYHSRQDELTRTRSVSKLPNASSFVNSVHPASL